MIENTVSEFMQPQRNRGTSNETLTETKQYRIDIVIRVRIGWQIFTVEFPKT